MGHDPSLSKMEVWVGYMDNADNHEFSFLFLIFLSLFSNNDLTEYVCVFLSEMFHFKGFQLPTSLARQVLFGFIHIACKCRRPVILAMMTPSIHDVSRHVTLGEDGAASQPSLPSRKPRAHWAPTR
jgi:hypothetical protein